MKILNHEETFQVSGGKNMYLTYRISTEGISNSCLSIIVDIIQEYGISEFDDSAYDRLDSMCTDSEAELIDDRMIKAPTILVNFE